MAQNLTALVECVKSDGDVGRHLCHEGTVGLHVHFAEGGFSPDRLLCE
jgi:hypothetical protein